MNDQRLREALRSVPPSEPGPAFTPGVIARLSEAPEREAPARRRPPVWAMAAAAAVLLVGAALGGRAALKQQRAAALRSETAEIARDLETLRREVQRSAPVLYVGGNEQVDLVLDLSTLPLAAAVPAPLTEASRETPR